LCNVVSGASPTPAIQCASGWQADRAGQQVEPAQGGRSCCCAALLQVSRVGVE
jgi:hypothetical protein